MLRRVEALRVLQPGVLPLLLPIAWQHGWPQAALHATWCGTARR